MQVSGKSSLWLRASAAVLLVGCVAACGESGPGGTAAASSGGGVTPPGTPVVPTTGTNLFMSIVPPGSNGNSAGGIGTPVSGTTQMGVPVPPVTKYPNNFRDQLDLYGDLSYAKAGLKADACTPPKNIGEHVTASDQACNYFKPAGITLAAADAVSTRTLTATNGKSVTILRDGWGVPYVTGDDRQSAEYGLGFAAAQDRLWLFDILRHVGRGNLSSFFGPADTTYSMDEEFGSSGGYSEDELTDIVNRTLTRVGAPIGPLFLADTQSFVAGMNAYIAYLQGAGAQELPPEYATLAAGANVRFPPPAFTVNDIVTNAVLIQSALGLGGGGEATNLNLLQKLDPSIAPGITTLPKAACDLFRDLRHANIPDTAYSAEGTFATQSPASIDETCPQTLPAGTAIWDAGSFTGRTLLTHGPIGGLPLTLPSCVPGTVPVIGGSCLPVGAGAVSGAQKPTVTIASRIESLGTLSIAAAAIPLPYKVHPPLKSLNDPIDATQALAMSDNPGRSLKDLLNRLGLPMTTSNWIAVNADQTQDGHPLAVMGPQTGYDNPQLLWEAAVVSNGGTKFDLASRGISTVNLPYIVIGHGLDFGWSPTSAGSDFTDTWVSQLCNVDGSPASRDDANGDGFPDADGYVYKGKCVKLYKRIDTWTASPTVASLALSGSATPETVKRYILRTHYGPVFGTALVKGVPYAISTQRSTFYADADAAIPFTVLASATGAPMTQSHFKELFNSMTSTFNWLYVDKKDTAYIQSGLYPLRAADANPELPNWGDGNHDWVIDQKLDASFFAQYGGDGNTGGKPFPTRNQAVAQGDPADGYFEWPGYLPLSSHIQDTNPKKGYLASWNNSGARGWWAADSNGTYGPTHRVKMLLNRLAAFKATGRKFDIGNMIEVMSDTAYTDLRGFDVMPEMLALMKQGTLTADEQTVADLMQAWLDDGSASWISNGAGLGAYRRDRDGDGVYDHRAAVVFMDAWYPHLIDSVLPQMTAVEAKGASLLTGRYDAPRAQGSAFQEGWFQHMKRTFDTALGTPGHVDYRVLKCASSSDASVCRQAILTAMDQAITDLGGVTNMANWDGSQLSNAKGRANAKVEDYDAVEHSSFSYLPVPAIPWLNRPTFQQAVEIYSDRSGQN